MVKQVDPQGAPGPSRAVSLQENATSPGQAGVSSEITREMS